jgi:uncharacterized protein (DUF2345 family)
MAKVTSDTKTETTIESESSEPARPSTKTGTTERLGQTHTLDNTGEAADATQPKVTKLGQIRTLLASPAGVSLAALRDATGWQSHSVRAALTGLRKGGEVIEKSKGEDGTTLYRLVAKVEAGQ